MRNAGNKVTRRKREMLRALAHGEREIARGRGFSLEQVLAKADRVLARAAGSKRC